MMYEVRFGKTLASCQVAVSGRVQVCLLNTPTRPPCRFHRLTVQSWEATSSRSPPSTLCTPAHCTLLMPTGCARQQASCAHTYSQFKALCHQEKNKRKDYTIWRQVKEKPIGLPR